MTEVRDTSRYPKTFMTEVRDTLRCIQPFTADAQEASRCLQPFTADAREASKCIRPFTADAREASRSTRPFLRSGQEILRWGLVPARWEEAARFDSGLTSADGGKRGRRQGESGGVVLAGPAPEPEQAEGDDVRGSRGPPCKTLQDGRDGGQRGLATCWTNGGSIC